ncbi:MAG: hypothetical protein DRQ02_02900, partial [Candidatus Latescibacterota bacterium]
MRGGNRLLIIILAIGLSVWGAPCSGRGFSPRADTLFAQGVRSYKTGEFLAALGNFQKILQELPPNQRSSAAQLMVAKALYKLGEYEQAIQAAQRLLEAYPKSRYSPYAVYLIAGCRFRQWKYIDAVEEYARVVGGRGDSKLRRRAQEIIDRIVETKLSPSQVEELRRKGLIGAREPEVGPVSPGVAIVGLLCPVS